MTFAFIGSFLRLYDEEGIARSLEAIGHTVHRFEETGFTLNTILELCNTKPDVLLVAKLKIDVRLRQHLLDECKKRGIFTVCWVPDLYVGLSRQWHADEKSAMFQCDLVCTPDGGHETFWQTRGIKHHLLRQGIYKEAAVAGRVTTFPYEIAFVGSNNPEFPYRYALMRALKTRYGQRFHWVGRNYTHEMRGDALADLYASVPIIVGDSVYSPYYWSNRVYETLGRCGFLIHPRVEGLDEEFTYYKHLIPYDYGNFDSLYEKIDYYLTHPKERDAIREAGQAYVITHYTLEHRCQQLLSIITDYRHGKTSA